MPSDFENSVKEFMISQKNFNALLEEKLLKVDDLARNVDRLSLDVDSLKLRSTPPKHDINESLKAMRISIDECKEITARLRAKRDCFVKVCSSSFHENNDQDLKVISNNCGNYYNNSYGNFNKIPSDFENSVKEFMISQNNFNALLEEKLLKVDDLARNVDILSLDVDSLKLRSTSPKHDINESLKVMRISIDECK